MVKRNYYRGKPMKILSSEITPEKIYKNRRKFIKQLGLTSSVFYLVPGLLNNAQASNKLTDYNYVTTYNIIMNSAQVNLILLNIQKIL